MGVSVGRMARCLLLVTTILVVRSAGTLSAQQRRGGGRAVWQTPGSRVALGYAADLFLPGRGEWSTTPVALDNLDLLLHLDLQEVVGLPGTSFRVQVQSNRGDPVSREVGDLQGISNLEAPREWRLYEAWVEQEIGSPRLSLLAGVRDINADFDVIPAAGDFFNGSFGFGPEYSQSGIAGPSTYPATALGARLRVEAVSGLYGLLGVSDGVPGSPGDFDFSLAEDEGALLSAEIGYAHSPVDPQPTPRAISRGEGRGRGRGLGAGGSGRQRRRIGRGRFIQDVGSKIAAGGWVYTRRVPSWSPGGLEKRSWGLYVLGEHGLYRDPDGMGELSGFARIGTAADAVNRLHLSLGGGLVYQGLLPGRPDDVVGVGMAHARNGSPYLQMRREEGSPLERAETVLELTYRAEVGPVFSIQPDLQWVKNPGMDPGKEDALVFGLRGYVLLEWPSGDSG